MSTENSRSFLKIAMWNQNVNKTCQYSQISQVVSA